MTIQEIKDLASRIPTLPQNQLRQRKRLVKVGGFLVAFYEMSDPRYCNAFLIHSTGARAQINLRNSSKEAIVAMILSCEDIFIKNAQVAECVRYKQATETGHRRL